MIRNILARIASRYLNAHRVHKDRMTKRERALCLARELGRDDLVDRLQSLRGRV